MWLIFSVFGLDRDSCFQVFLKSTIEIIYKYKNVEVIATYLVFI